MSTAAAEPPVKPAEPTKPNPAPPVTEPKPGEAGASVFADRFTGKKSKPATPAAAAAPAPAAAPAAPAAAAPPKPTPPKPAPAAAAPAVPSFEGLDEKIAKGIKDGMSAAQPKPAEPADELTPEQTETIIVLERMEKEYPDEKGKKQAFLDATKRAADYQKEWEKDNPGETFDAADEAHNKFFEKNDVQWDDHRYYKTLAKIEAEGIVEKRDGKNAEKLTEMERREKLRDAAPVIAGRQAETAKSFFTGLGDEYKSVLDENGNINVAEVKRLREADPVKAIAFSVAQSVEVFAGELHKLVEGLSGFDETNPVHINISQFIANEEELMKSLPPEQSIYQGKRFVTADEYGKMPKDKRAGVWRYTEKDLARIHAERMADYVKETVEKENTRLEEVAKARGWKKETPPAAGSPPAAAAAPTPTDTPPKPSSPAPTMEPRLAPPAGGGGRSANSATSDFLTRFKG